MLKIQFDTDNAAFDAPDDGAGMCAKILRHIATAIDRGHTEDVVHDPNGNSVGEWSLSLSENGSEYR